MVDVEIVGVGRQELFVRNFGELIIPRNCAKNLGKTTIELGVDEIVKLLFLGR